MTSCSATCSYHMTLSLIVFDRKKGTCLVNIMNFVKLTVDVLTSKDHHEVPPQLCVANDVSSLHGVLKKC